MKIWTAEHTFNHPWETVTQAVWRKYPNPHKPEILSTHVVKRNVVDGVLYTNRLVTSRWWVPCWATKILGTDRICHAVEASEVDPTRQVMTMRTRNITFASIVSMDEWLEYKPHPSDSKKTVLQQETVITVHGIPLSSYCEGRIMNSICSSSFRGRDAMEWIINKINTEVEDLVNSYKRSTSDLLNTTRKSIGEITESAMKSYDDFSDKAKKSIDDLSTATKKGIDEIQSFTSTPPSIPRV